MRTPAGERLFDRIHPPGLAAEPGASLPGVTWEPATAPKRVDNWSLEPTGPSVEVPAIITGFPTGRLDAVLRTDPGGAGSYQIEIRMNGGNSVHHVITTG